MDIGVVRRAIGITATLAYFPVPSEAGIRFPHRGAAVGRDRCAAGGRDDRPTARRTAFLERVAATAAAARETPGGATKRGFVHASP